jgi:hypothetical protein
VNPAYFVFFFAFGEGGDSPNPDFEFLVGVHKDLRKPRNWVMFGPVGLSRRL